MNILQHPNLERHCVSHPSDPLLSLIKSKLILLLAFTPSIKCPEARTLVPLHFCSYLVTVLGNTKMSSYSQSVSPHHLCHNDMPPLLFTHLQIKQNKNWDKFSGREKQLSIKVWQDTASSTLITCYQNWNKCSMFCSHNGSLQAFLRADFDRGMEEENLGHLVWAVRVCSEESPRFPSSLRIKPFCWKQSEP